MMKSILPIFLLFFVGCQTLTAQTGNYFLSHYSPSEEKINYPSFDMLQDNTGIIYFANKKGVIKFDGRNWDVIATPEAVYTLCLSEDNSLYLGGLHGFGKIQTHAENGVTGYESISKDTDDAKNIFASLILGDHAYFLKDSKLFIINLSTDKIDKVVTSSPLNLFISLFEIKNEVYIGQENGTLLHVEVPDQGEPKTTKASLPFAPTEEILFTEKSSEGRFLIVAASGRIWINETNTGVRELKLKDSDYLSSNVVINGTWVNDHLIALGTLRGGILFADAQTGNTEEITNYFTGLPDNEVVALMGDRSQGVWVAHEYGFTRIAPYLPFRTFNHYSGIEGNLLCAISFQNQVYVGTTVGLYKLNRREIYEDEVYYVEKQTFGKKVTTLLQSKPKASNAKLEREKSKRGIFGFLRKDRVEKTPSKTVTKPQPSASKDGRKKTIVQERKVRRVLKGISYAYSRIEGINGKVTQLISANNQLIAAGASGVFDVREASSKILLSQPVRTIFISSSLHQVFASTYEDDVLTFSIEPSGWTETNVLDTLHDRVNYIFEDHLQNIWLCSLRGAYKAETIDNQVSNVEFIPYAHITQDEFVGFPHGKNVYMASLNEFDVYNSTKNTFTAYDQLPAPQKILASSGYFWFNDGHEWRTFDKKISDAMELEWLKLFPNIRFLAPTGDGKSLWVITSKNELYKFTAGKKDDQNSSYPLFLREVRGKQANLPPAKSIDVDQLQGALAFEFIQPEFMSEDAVEYRYRVSGLSEDWSEWSPVNNVIQFPFLTPGTYELNIESKNLFGKASQLTPIQLKVHPPIWRRSWFVALEIFFFSALVLLSIHLGAGNSKYRYISRFLSLLTVIMFIQFIQTIVQSQISLQTNPVFDFFIQVGIAFLVLPLEGRLRKFMNESAEGKYELKGLRKVMRRGTE